MSKNESRFRTESTISCCHYCVPPKRHTACWDHCPEYLKQKAEFEAKKAERRKKVELDRGLDAQKYAAVKRAQKGGKYHA